MQADEQRTSAGPQEDAPSSRISTARPRRKPLADRLRAHARRRWTCLVERIVSVLPGPLQHMAISMRLLEECIPMHALPGKYQSALELLLDEREQREFGDYLEFGVYQGSSMSCMHRAAETLGVRKMRLIGFDSFAGLPHQATREDEGLWSAGQYSATRSYATAYLRHHCVDTRRVILIEGWFEQTCSRATAERYGIRKAAIINIDCDLYSSTKTALTFCRPLIHDAVVIFFDDWHAGGLADKGLGELRAFEEFLRDNPDLSARELPDLAYNENSTVFYVSVMPTATDSERPAS